MLMLLRVVGEAVAAQALRALTGQVPMNDRIYEISSDVIRRYRAADRTVWINDDVRELLQARPDEIRLESQQVAREVAGGESPDMIRLLEAYLSQFPAVARQALKRPNDPSGTTIPNEMNLLEPVHFASLLPRRQPRFRAQDSVPQAPQWKFVELLGAGGFGEVWLAQNDAIEERRAFKFCLDPASRDRLLRHEAQVVNRVKRASADTSSTDHGIVKLLDACLEGDAPWLAYEYVDGGDLTAVVRELAKLDPAERARQALSILRNLAGVVGHFHRLPHPVVHRDLKPANVLVQKHGDRWLLRVTDFGISHIAADQSMQESMASTPSMSIGATFRGACTPIYASPQQKRGDKASVRDDVYALGIIGFQLLMGDLTRERPTGKNWRKQLMACQLPVKVIDFLASCWDDDPEERPRDAADFVRRLDHALRNEDAPDEPLPPPKKSGPVVPPENRITDPIPPPNKPEEIEGIPKPSEPPPVPIPQVDSNTVQIDGGSGSTLPPPPPQESAKDRKKPKRTRQLKDAMTELFGSVERDYESWVASFKSGGATTVNWLRQNEENVQVWQLAANRGVVAAYPILACAYSHGVGVDQDHRSAYEWYLKSAEEGDMTAMNELGTCYYEGNGVERNYDEALRWYRRAAELGNAASLCWLGWMYCNGHGVRKDYSEAMRNFHQAADAGLAAAHYAIGTMYEKGNGVKQSMSEAIGWYRRAADLGSQEAQRSLLELSEHC